MMGLRRVESAKCVKVPEHLLLLVFRWEEQLTLHKNLRKITHFIVSKDKSKPTTKTHARSHGAKKEEVEPSTEAGTHI